MSKRKELPGDDDMLRAFKAVKRSRGQKRAIARVDDIVAAPTSAIQVPLQMMVQGELTADRRSWQEDALKYIDRATELDSNNTEYSEFKKTLLQNN